MTSLALDPLPLLAATGFDYALQQPLFPGKLFLWGLFMLSLLSWGIIISKGVSFFRMKRADEEFVKFYRGGRQPLQLFERNYEDERSLRWVIYDHGAREAAFQMLGSPERDATFSVRLRSTEGLTGNQMKAVREALSRGELAAAARLRDGMPLLSVTSLGAPFVGLLGMAWILMKTFSINGMDGTLAEVSPGVSGALAMLVAGLLAGTPALIGQIILGALSREQMRVLGDFRSQYGRALEYAYASGRALPGGDDEEEQALSTLDGEFHHDQPMTAYERANRTRGGLADLDESAIDDAAQSIESHSEDSDFYGGASPFVLIDEDDDPKSTEIVGARPIAAFADPQDDHEEGFLFRTPFGRDSDEDGEMNPIARQAGRAVQTVPPALV